jgi:hypothetical protein
MLRPMALPRASILVAQRLFQLGRIQQGSQVVQRGGAGFTLFIVAGQLSARLHHGSSRSNPSGCSYCANQSSTVRVPGNPAFTGDESGRYIQ